MKKLLKMLQVYSENKGIPAPTLIIEKDGSGSLVSNPYTDSIHVPLFEFRNIDELIDELKS